MRLDERKYVVGGIFIIIAFIYLIRLFYIQVINDKYKLSSENNTIKKVDIYPSRGVFYDRNGRLLVSNEPGYDIMVIPSQIKDLDTAKFCNLLGITIEDFRAKLEKANQGQWRYKPSVFEKGIDIESYGIIQEKLLYYPGFYAETSTLRKYPSFASHLIGYLGEVSPGMLERDSVNYYRQGDIVGWSGIEAYYENVLRGKRGTKLVLVDVFNNEKGSYANGKFDTTAIPGSSLNLTIDAELQKYGEILMQNKVGSIVAIEPSTGEILSLVSSPTFDNNLLVGKKRNKNFRELQLNDTLNPLFNRALQAKYPPGSIFKLVQALIGMEEGVITENFGAPCNKSLVGCHNHPMATNVKKGVQFSCNPYFYAVFKRVINQNKSSNYFKDTEIGLGLWNKHIETFGLGKRLNVDLTNVSSGGIPTPNYYDKIYGKGRWAYSTIYSLSIGQGEVEVIPMQMANLAAIMANKGYYYTPHVVKSIQEADTVSPLYYPKINTSVSSKYYDVIHEGMRAVVEEPGGTARRAKIDSITVCGKTGTAQNPHGEDHSVFIAFAPMENPKIAIAVYVENAGFGGTWAAPIASLMMEKYLTGEIKNKAKEERILKADIINRKNMQ